MFPPSLNRLILPALALCALAHGVARAASIKAGPMIGHTTHQSATFWARSTGGGTFTVKVSEKADMAGAITSDAVKFDKARDATARVTVKGLKPLTTYHWRAFVDGVAHTPPQGATMKFRTFPPPGQPARLKLAMGSCNSFMGHPNSPIWNGVKAEDPDAFFWLGDNLYADRQPSFVVSGLYNTQRTQTPLVPVLLSTPQYAIWDDHDFGDNDHDRTLATKGTFLKLFKDWWANESYGEPDNPGVYSKLTIGPADVFLLDCRYHRDPNAMPDSQQKTMLGTKQMSWLQQGLLASRATVKLLACGSAWNDNTHFIDNWTSHRFERDRLFDFIRDKKIPGVVLISGDTHVGELNAIPRTHLGGYDLYEFVASPLANGNDPVDIYMKSAAKRLRPVDGAGYNFGLITIDTLAKPATVSYELIRPDGKRIWSKFTVPVSELENGKGDWKKYVADMGQWEGVVNR